MSMIEALIQELEQEAQTTRRLLERVQEQHLAWKPHATSMSMGELAHHIATIPGAIATISQRSPFQMSQLTQSSATSAAELVPTLDQSIRTAREILQSMDDSALQNIFRLLDGDRELVAMPVGAVLRSIMLNHWYHHRGQLSVYLRQLGVPLPSIYGPSADENPFARPAASTVSV